MLDQSNAPVQPVRYYVIYNKRKKRSVGRNVYQPYSTAAAARRRGSGQKYSIVASRLARAVICSGKVYKNYSRYL